MRGGALHSFSFAFLQCRLQHERTKRILALIPKERAPSETSEKSDSDNELDNLYNSNSSSPAPSLDSSLERMNLLDDAPANQYEIYEDANFPLTPILQEILPSPNQEPNFLNLPSISSLPSLNTPSPVTRKRKQTSTNSVVTKKPKKLERFSLDYNWKKSTFLHNAVIEDAVITASTSKVRSPLQYFFSFFSPDIITDIINETNAYSIQKTGRSIQVTHNDLRDFLAIHIMMGIVPMNSYLDYWSVKYRYDKVADVMPLKRYEQIRRFIHFTDNNFENTDRYYKIRPVMEKIRQNCLAHEDENKFSIDEMMIAYKGHKAGKRRQYMKDKPTKWGFKNYVRAGTSGMIYDFVMYGGEDTFRNHTFTEKEQSLGFGGQVVIALCQSIKQKPAMVYFDNFFSSPELVYLLRNDYGLFSLGTIRKNRLRGAEGKLIGEKTLKKKKRGSYSRVVCNKNKLSVVRWNDNKCVTLISSYTDAEPIHKVKRYCKVAKKKIDVDYPNIVKDYNQNMGGVDLADMLISLYKTPFRTRRWYIAIFSQLIDICINNAWILYRKDIARTTASSTATSAGPVQIREMRLKDFRYETYNGLLKSNRTTSQQRTENSSIRHPCKARPDDDSRFDQVGHFPSTKEEGRCMFCNKKTTVYCLKCNARMCFITGKSPRNCFLNFHVK